MDALSENLREWMSLDILNGQRLVRLLNFIYFLLEHIFDSFTGRHWAFLCSVIHCSFSGHFEPVSNFFVDHPSTSIFLFANSLLPSDLDHFISDLSFSNCLIRELISFHQFKRLPNPELLVSSLFAAADCLSIALLAKFVKSIPLSFPNPSVEEDASFSPNLSPITEIHPLSQHNPLEVDPEEAAHIQQQFEDDLDQQNEQDQLNFEYFHSGYHGVFWDELEGMDGD